MKLIKILFLFFSCAIISFYSCTDDSEIICEYNNIPCESPIPQTLFEVDSCFELPYDIFGQLPIVSSPKICWFPIYHPLNQDEFIFSSGDSNGQFIFKNNTCNEFLEKGVDLSQFDNPLLLDINKNDIVLIKSWNKYFSVNFDGTNLEEIKNDEYELSGLRWCGEDTLIYATIQPFDSNSPYHPFRAALINKEGIVQTVFPEGIGNSSSDYKNGKILTSTNAIQSSSNFQYGFIDISTTEFTPIFDFAVPSIDNFYISNFKWLDDDNVVFLENHINNISQRLIKMNINTLDRIVLFEEGCQNIKSGIISVNPNKNDEILRNMVHYEYSSVAPDSLDFLVQIVKVNTETGEEWILDINL